MGPGRCTLRATEGLPISLPDRLALFRVLLVPAIIGLVLATAHTEVAHLFGFAAFLVAVAAFTDYLDGAIARKRGITTVLGAFLDTTADKILVSGALIALVSVDRASVWVTVIIMTREFVVMAVRSVVAIDGGVVPASVAGKIKAAVQFMALGLAMLRLDQAWGPWFLDQYWMWLAAAVTIVAGWDYLVRFRQALKDVDRPVGT